MPTRSRTSRAPASTTTATSPLAAALALLLMTLPVALLGCRGDLVDTDYARTLAELRYPEDAQRGPALDILVQTRGREVQLINRTPRRYHNMQLWFNREYVREVDEVAIGEENHFDLHSFINRFQEPFPTGWLLAPDRRRPLVLAELYDPDANVRYPLQAQR